jgi:hypothetical protein
MSKTLLAFVLLAGTGAAAQQAPKPAALPADERPRLNLKLDQPARLYTRETPPEGAGAKGGADNLPSLGGNPVYAAPPPPVRPDGKFSYPKDTEQRP